MCFSSTNRLVYNALFSEMTILGFISLICYVVTYGSFLDGWSLDIFGTDEEYYISDTIGDVQGYVMWVMVMIMLHSVALVSISKQSERSFVTYNEIAQDDNEIAKIIDKLDNIPSKSLWDTMLDYLTNPIATWERNSDHREIESQLVFHSLRREHIIRRSGTSLPAEEEPEKILPKDFDYAIYLSICQSNILADIVSCSPLAWFCLWLYIVLMFSVLMIVDEYYSVFSSFLVFAAYADLILMHMLSYHCKGVLEHLVNPSHLKSRNKLTNEDDDAATSIVGSTIVNERFSKSEIDNHSSFLVRLRHSSEKIPKFMKMDLRGQSWLSRLLLGRHMINRYSTYTD